MAYVIFNLSFFRKMATMDHTFMKFGLMSALLLMLLSDFRDIKSKILGKNKDISSDAFFSTAN